MKYARLIAVIASCAVGWVWRYIHLVSDAPLTQFVLSDMKGYHDAALNYFDPSYRWSIADTIYPPGTAYYFGWLQQLDSSWALAHWSQFLLSCAMPVGIGLIGARLFGRTVGTLALCASMFYWPFVDYFVYILAEGPYMFLLVLAFVGVAFALPYSFATRDGRAVEAPRSRWMLAAFGLSIGLVLGLAGAVKSAALPIGVFLGCFCVIAQWRGRFRNAHYLLVAGVLGFLLIVAPLSVRATRLSDGKFTLISNTAPLNMLGSQLPDFRLIEYKDKKGRKYGFGNPTKWQRAAVRHKKLFHFGPYETDRVMAEVKKIFRRDPLKFLQNSLNQTFDLLPLTVPWPSSHTKHKGKMVFSQQCFLVLVLLPAFMATWRCMPRLWRFDRTEQRVALLAIPPATMMLVCFLTAGEPRYRIPIDAFLVVLASSEWVVWLRSFRQPGTSLASEPSASGLR